MQNLLVMRLQQLEEGDGAAAQGVPGGQRLELGPDEVVGSRQRDLLEWYFKYLVER